METSPSAEGASPPYIMYGAEFENAASDLIVPCTKGVFVVACKEIMFRGGTTLVQLVEKSTEEEGTVVLSAEPPLMYALDRLGEV